MKALRLNIKFLTFLGICSQRLSESTNEFMKTIQSYIFLFGFLGPLLSGSAIFLMYNFSDMEASTNAMIVLTAGVASFGSFMTMGFKMKTVKHLHNEFQAIADQAENTDAFRFYVSAENLGMLHVKWISLSFTTHISLGAFGMAICNSIFNVYRGNWDSTTWYLPYKMVTPFDRGTLIGYICTWFTQLLAGYTYIFTMSAVVTFFVCCCLYIEACVLQFKQIFETIDENLKTSKSYVDKGKLEANLREAVVFHIKIMELCDILSGISSAPIFFQLICNVVFFASAMFQITMTQTLIDIDLTYNVLCMIVGLSWTFLFCYYSTSVTRAMADIGHAVYNSHWYLYPLHLRKYPLLIIARSQVNFYFTGFKMVRCTLETFTKLSNSAVSYFLMFRKVATR